MVKIFGLEVFGGNKGGAPTGKKASGKFATPEEAVKAAQKEHDSAVQELKDAKNLADQTKLDTEAATKRLEDIEKEISDNQKLVDESVKEVARLKADSASTVQQITDAEKIGTDAKTAIETATKAKPALVAEVERTGKAAETARTAELLKNHEAAQAAQTLREAEAAHATNQTETARKAVDTAEKEAKKTQDALDKAKIAKDAADLKAENAQKLADKLRGERTTAELEVTQAKLNAEAAERAATQAQDNLTNLDPKAKPNVRTAAEGEVTRTARELAEAKGKLQTAEGSLPDEKRVTNAEKDATSARQNRTAKQTEFENAENAHAPNATKVNEAKAKVTQAEASEDVASQAAKDAKDTAKLAEEAHVAETARVAKLAEEAKAAEAAANVGGKAPKAGGGVKPRTELTGNTAELAKGEGQVRLNPLKRGEAVEGTVADLKVAAESSAKGLEAAGQSATLIKAVGKVGVGGLELASKVAKPLIVLKAGYDTVQDVSKGHYKDAAADVTGTVGGMAGAEVGAVAGAEVGAAVGSIVPVFGTVVGGVVGGFIGGFVGWNAGEAAAKGGTKAIIGADTVENDGKPVEGMVNEAGQSLKGAVGSTGKLMVAASGTGQVIDNADPDADQGTAAPQAPRRRAGAPGAPGAGAAPGAPATGALTVTEEQYNTAKTEVNTLLEKNKTQELTPQEREQALKDTNAIGLYLDQKIADARAAGDQKAYDNLTEERRRNDAARSGLQKEDRDHPNENSPANALISIIAGFLGIDPKMLGQLFNFGDGARKAPADQSQGTGTGTPPASGTSFQGTGTDGNSSIRTAEYRPEDKPNPPAPDPVKTAVQDHIEKIKANAIRTAELTGDDGKAAADTAVQAYKTKLAEGGPDKMNKLDDLNAKINAFNKVASGEQLTNMSEDAKADYLRKTGMKPIEQEQRNKILANAAGKSSEEIQREIDTLDKETKTIHDKLENVNSLQLASRAARANGHEKTANWDLATSSENTADVTRVLGDVAKFVKLEVFNADHNNIAAPTAGGQRGGSRSGSEHPDPTNPKGTII